MWLWLILGGLAVAAMGGGTRAARLQLAPGLTGVSTEGDGIYVGPPQDISAANGWRPVFIEASHARRLEWGACFYAWQQDIMSHDMVDSSTAAQRMTNALAKTMNYVLDLAPVLGWLVKRICFRTSIPATAVKIDGDWYFIPRSPTDPALPKARASSAGGVAVPGWNPQSTRFGIALRWPEWPLEWPPPQGKIAGAWVKNLGDITGTGFDTWQLVTAQGGSERSFPMMSESGWRAVFGFSEFKWPGHENGDPLSMFHEWRAGGDGVSKGAATKKKAENRYQRPA